MGQIELGYFWVFLDLGRKSWPEPDPTHRHVFFFSGWFTHAQIYHIHGHRLGTCLVPTRFPLASLGMSNEMIDKIANFGSPKPTRKKNLPTEKSRWASYTSKHNHPLCLLARQRIQIYLKFPTWFARALLHLRLPIFSIYSRSPTQFFVLDSHLYAEKTWH